MKKRITSVMLAVGLISALGVAPAFGIAINGPNGEEATVVLDTGTAPDSNPAHGPLCGVAGGPADCDGGVSPNTTPAATNEPIDHPTNSLGLNAGAWNAVFGPGGMSNPNTPICGIRTVELPGLDDGTLGTNTCVTNV